MKNKLYLIGLVIFVMIALTIALYQVKPKEEIKIEKVVIPTRTQEPYSSDTGAMDLEMTDEQYKEGQLINKLRDISPYTTTSFMIDYDYNIDKFIVIIKPKYEENLVKFKLWMEQTGYKDINESWFLIKNQ